MTDLITLENPDGPIAYLRINRPAKKNALTLEMLDAFSNVVASLARKTGLRAVILSGAGADFCAGLDTSVFLQMAGQIDDLKSQILSPDPGPENRFQRPAKSLFDLPVPVIAVIEGVCFGAGMQIALAADFRIATPDARLSIMEGKWGLIPDMGLSLTLPALMPADKAKRLIMNADILSGSEAKAQGLVTEVAEAPHEAALVLAQSLLSRSPDALRAAKQLVDQIWGSAGTDGLRLEAELQAQIIGGANQIETVMAQMQKRPPKFT